MEFIIEDFTFYNSCYQARCCIVCIYSIEVYRIYYSICSIYTVQVAIYVYYYIYSFHDVLLADEY